MFVIGEFVQRLSRVFTDLTRITRWTGHALSKRRQLPLVRAANRNSLPEQTSANLLRIRRVWKNCGARQPAFAEVLHSRPNPPSRRSALRRPARWRRPVPCARQSVMHRVWDEGQELCHGLLRALIVASLIYQGVVGSAHLAFAAAAPDSAFAPAICSAYGAGALPADFPDQAPGQPDTQDNRTCSVCASNHQAAGSVLPPAADIDPPGLRANRHRARAHDQWPADRQPQVANSRAPPRS